MPFASAKRFSICSKSLTGSRMMCNYMRFGGCRVDLPAGWLEPRAKSSTASRASSTSSKTLLTGNEILMARTQGIGVLPPELAVNAGITGPMLRATGVNYDLRKVDNYGIYDRFNFRVPLGDHGDVYDRYMIRVLEMRESVEDSEAGAAGHSRRPDHGSEGEAPRLPPQGRRGLRPHRSAQGRTRFLSHQRRLARIPIAIASARRASSTSPSSKTCASATTSPTWSSSSAAWTLCWARWIDETVHRCSE